MNAHPCSKCGGKRYHKRSCPLHSEHPDYIVTSGLRLHPSRRIDPGGSERGDSRFLYRHPLLWDLARALTRRVTVREWWYRLQMLAAIAFLTLVVWQWWTK